LKHAYSAVFRPWTTKQTLSLPTYRTFPPKSVFSYGFIPFCFHRLDYRAELTPKVTRSPELLNCVPKTELVVPALNLTGCRVFRPHFLFFPVRHIPPPCLWEDLPAGDEHPADPTSGGVLWSTVHERLCAHLPSAVDPDSHHRPCGGLFVRRNPPRTHASEASYFPPLAR